MKTNQPIVLHNYFVYLDEILDSSINEHLLYVHKNKQRNLGKVPFKRQKIVVCSDILIRVLASKYTGIPFSDILFRYNQYGKPYIENSSSFNYNISHTENIILFSISNAPVGCDIEKIKTPDYRIAKRFFTSNEYGYVVNGEQNSSANFCEVWTKKESYVKYLGQGLSYKLSSFDVFDFKLIRRFYSICLGNHMASIFTHKPSAEAQNTIFVENNINKIIKKILLSDMCL